MDCKMGDIELFARSLLMLCEGRITTDKVTFEFGDYKMCVVRLGTRDKVVVEISGQEMLDE